MALRSLLARTTTTLCRARAPSSGPIGVVHHRMSSPASSSRRYASQGGYGRYWDKEFDRHHTDHHLRKLREELNHMKESSRSDKIRSFMQPIEFGLGLGLYTVACIGAGYCFGSLYGFSTGFGIGVCFVRAVDKVVANMKLDENTDDDDDEDKDDDDDNDDIEGIGKVAKVKLDESTDDGDIVVEGKIGEVVKVKLDECTDDKVV